MSVTVKVVIHALCAAIGCVLAAPLCSWSQDRVDWEVISNLSAGSPVVLPVCVAGDVRWFVLDSGTSVHMFDVSLRQHLGTPLGTASGQVGGVSGIEFEKIRIPPMRVGRIRLSPEPNDLAVSFDFAPVRQVLDHDVRGLLGTPFFRGRLVEIDYDQGVVRVAKRDMVDRIQGTLLNLRMDNFGVPWVDGLRVANRVESFAVDTGSNGQISLHKWLFEALAREDQLEIDPISSRMETLAGCQSTRCGWLSEFSCAGFSHRDLLVEEGSSNSLGLAYLSRFVVIIDLSGNRMYLRAGNQFDRQDRIDRSGMVVEKVEGVLKVREVEEEGPAFAAGIRVGDKVLAIDGKACEHMGRNDFHGYLRDAEGRMLTVTVIRQNESIKVTLNIPRRKDKPDKRGQMQFRPLSEQDG
jgi:hypothetical protein